MRSGVGYASDALDGLAEDYYEGDGGVGPPTMGRYGPGNSLAPAPQIPPTKQQVEKSEDDVLTFEVMECLERMLSERDAEGNVSPKLLQSLFFSSFLLERVADLLRNNDLEDVTSRPSLYMSVTKFVRTLSAHPSTSSLAFGERTLRTPGANILRVSLGKEKLNESDGTHTLQPLSLCIRELGSQAEIMLKQRDGDTKDIALFTSIKDLNDFMLANAGCIEQMPIANKNAWHHELAVADIADDILLSRHSLAAKANAGNRPAGQMKSIMRGIALLKSSLPDGIFVRHGETRPDVMKILIIGPKDSPYENGLFEFDLLCGADYPRGPPLMKFRTTGGGIVHFNPNLYPDGKVCLSILGTWEGKPWIEKQSTLLQVLLSIQASKFSGCV